MPDTIADLTTASDLELDAALQIGYRQHSAAMAAGDPDATLECHAAIMAILDVQEERRHMWLDQVLGIG